MPNISVLESDHTLLDEGDFKQWSDNGEVPQATQFSASTQETNGFSVQ